MAGAFGKGQRLRSGQVSIGSSPLELIHSSDDAQPRTRTNGNLVIAADDPDRRSDRLCVAAIARVQAGTDQSGRATRKRRLLRSDGGRHPVGHEVSFWVRLLRIPIPFRRSNLFLNHLFLFLGRLSFIFGSALFSVVVFRHLPELGRDTDFLLLARRGFIFFGCLFALFTPASKSNGWARRLAATEIEGLTFLIDCGASVAPSLLEAGQAIASR
jgi:hypothetical protein